MSAPPETNPIVEAMRTGTLMSLWAGMQPDVIAVESPHGRRTYAELNARANQIARMLRAGGLREGDSVALLCANRPEFVEVLQATGRSGLRLTPINWHVTADEAAYVVADCGAKAFFADARFADVAAAATRDSQPDLLLAIGGAIEGFSDYEAEIAEHVGDDIDNPSMGTTMLYTSGTTGRPKGVHREARANTNAGATALLEKLRAASGFQAGKDVTLVTGPLYHAAPLAFALSLPLAYGTTVVLMDGWDAEETLRLVEDYGVTHTHMVPTMFHRLLSLPADVRSKYDVSSLRLIWHGAAPCPVPVKKALIDWVGPIVWEYYGATEGLTTVVTSEEWLAKPGTVGRPEPGQIVVFDDDGNASPAGVPGTLYIKAPDEGRFAYYGDDEKTSKAYRGDYYTLGDVGYLDEDGWLFLTDRSTNLIISGGVNIYPAEVEAVLIAHHAVGDVAVIGVPNEEWGEEVKAVVELQPGHEASSELAHELITFARGNLAGYKVPRSVDFVARLPREDNGKLYKRALREQYRAKAAQA
jgi:long-chain acyl-CoA synthetase